MKVQGNKYTVTYDSATETVTCSGTLDMRGKDGYKEIWELFDYAAGSVSGHGTVTLDIRHLEFLNSSGITAIGGFVIKLRNKGNISLLILCSNQHSWQAKSMTGLEKLMPSGLSLRFE